MASREQYLQRKENLGAILSEVRRRGEATRNELMEALSLSWACVSDLTAHLLSCGILIEEKCGESGGRGRIPGKLRPAPDKLFLGVDVNLSGLTVSVCDNLFHPVDSERLPIEAAEAGRLTQSVIQAVQGVLKRHGVGCLGIGIAMQGIRRRTSDLWEFPGANGAFEVALGSPVSQACGLPVLVEHDPNCILYGFSDAKEQGNVLMLRIDNGVGAALCRNGAFADFGALELGHTVVNENGDTLYSLASIRGIEKRLGRSLGEGIDGAAEEALAKAGTCLGMALSNLCNLISVDRVILCGEMMRYSSYFLQNLKEAYGKHVLKSQEAEISVSKLVNAAFGAAKLAAARYPFE
ncbi:MAG: ROK family protein [Clostridia bacterium]|nr:ROK family protein [Clostridia bacterium]